MPGLIGASNPAQNYPFTLSHDWRLLNQCVYHCAFLVVWFGIAELQISHYCCLPVYLSESPPL
tara:strand:+ start:295 stop:483 length:189 start_codon:yes stop_codon:yes gene_type:complete